MNTLVKLLKAEFNINASVEKDVFKTTDETLIAMWVFEKPYQTGIMTKILDLRNITNDIRNHNPLLSEVEVVKALYKTFEISKRYSCGFSEASRSAAKHYYIHYSPFVDSLRVVEGEDTLEVLNPKILNHAYFKDEIKKGNLIQFENYLISFDNIHEVELEINDQVARPMH